jgi:hypothetical protein
MNSNKLINNFILSFHEYMTVCMIHRNQNYIDINSNNEYIIDNDYMFKVRNRYHSLLIIHIC